MSDTDGDDPKRELYEIEPADTAIVLARVIGAMLHMKGVDKFDIPGAIFDSVGSIAVAYCPKHDTYTVYLDPDLPGVIETLSQPQPAKPTEPTEPASTPTPTKGESPWQKSSQETLSMSDPSAPEPSGQPFYVPGSKSKH